MEIRTQSGISQIIVKNGKAKGVVLASGDEVYADVISSSVDPRLTFTKFIEAQDLPGDIARQRLGEEEHDHRDRRQHYDRVPESSKHVADHVGRGFRFLVAGVRT